MSERAAALLYELVVNRTNAAQVYRAEYGNGMFYLAFETPTEALAFASKPELTYPGLLYMNEAESRTLGLPDATLGAIVSGRAPAVVVVDQFKPGLRCASDSTGAVNAVPITLTRRAVVTGPSPEAIAAAEQHVREMCTAAADDDDDDGGASVYFVEYGDDGDDVIVERLTLSDIDSAVQDYVANEENASIPQSMASLRQLAQDCPPDAVVIWLKSPGVPDTAWTAQKRLGVQAVPE